MYQKPSCDFPFNVRVYGILIMEEHVLLSHESHKGITFTKFPGGGLEFGEGTEQCLKREYMEETGVAINVVSHIYTTDFFQASAFNQGHQVISIYYKVRPVDITSTKNVIQEIEENQRFEWIDLKILNADHFTFPIDKLVCQMMFKT